MNIVMLVYPGMTPLDMVGPLQVFSRLPGVDIQLVWKSLDPVVTDAFMPIVPTHTFETACAAPDMLFAGGGEKPTLDLLGDAETIAFLKDRGEKAAWVCSVCSGSLLLGAAGLLQGYKATTHWGAMPMLETFGAIPTQARYVIDRNRATGGGVTAGIDFGLAIAAEIAGEEYAKITQLTMEYSPAPPFNCGTPEEAEPEILEKALEMMAASLGENAAGALPG